MENKIYLVQVLAGECGYHIDEVYIIKANSPEEAAQVEAFNRFKAYSYYTFRVYDLDGIVGYSDLPIALSDAVEVYSCGKNIYE